MSDATTPAQIEAIDAAYHFAIQLLRSEFHYTDGNEIASIASAYALAQWPDWVLGEETDDSHRDALYQKLSSIWQIDVMVEE